MISWFYIVAGLVITQIQAADFLNTFKCFFGYFEKSHLVYRAKLIKPRFYVESQIWKKDPHLSC